jgi:hypothetical protein
MDLFSTWELVLVFLINVTSMNLPEAREGAGGPAAGGSAPLPPGAGQLEKREGKR